LLFSPIGFNDEICRSYDWLKITRRCLLLPLSKRFNSVISHFLFNRARERERKKKYIRELIVGKTKVKRTLKFTERDTLLKPI